MATRQKSKPPELAAHLIDTNFSSRNGAPIQAIAVHSTESWDRPGWDDLHGVRSWFNNPVADASSHVGIDGEGHIERWVRDADKAWTILQLNPVTLNIEFVARASQPRSDWEEKQIKAGAQMAAYWCVKYGIRAQRGAVKNVNGWPVVTTKGIIKHSDLTKAGFGTHTDPGANFPMKRFIELVQWYKRNGWYPNTSDEH
jgi:N-acetyl-anhydromuramyl-L-alanine amidase AmpD